MSNYGQAYENGSRDGRPQKKRWTLRKWLRDYIKDTDEGNIMVSVSEGPRDISNPSFNKRFDGWNIRLHRANGGYIIEAWKNDDDRMISKNSRPDHEFFLVREDEDMGQAINDTLIQLMLRG